ncbi:MAG: hypothetical protein ACD_15C00208G0003 [uncultured bacterium]|nr:MAG: hypothetical protein ACD_15C00208G0003 [uncultured bacterium]
MNYPAIIESIASSIQKILPDNKVSKIKKKDTCFDISCYSNKWEKLLGWKAKEGSKYKQKVSIPDWVKNNKTYSKHCLKGLFETDGSIYMDRGYKMANFVTIIPTLATDVLEMITRLGFVPNMQTRKNETGKTKHTIRISKNTDKFIQIVDINKS